MPRIQYQQYILNRRLRSTRPLSRCFEAAERDGDLSSRIALSATTRRRACAAAAAAGGGGTERRASKLLGAAGMGMSWNPAGVASIAAADVAAQLGLYPIVTSQYSSTTLYQVSYHIQ